MKFKPEKQSIKEHEVPTWFQDAKFGIFIHWGLYSVPAFAVTGLDLVESMKKGLDQHFKNNPYAEWYLNSLRIDGSPTQKYHFSTYGEKFSYDDFVSVFNEEIKKWNPDHWATFFKKIGVKYVVLTTKHCDGFLLWQSYQPNPHKKNYIASRDIVGELTEAVKKQGMKMGFYYSTAWDWSFNLNPIKDAVSFLENYVNPPEYTEYVNNHIYELIDKFEPSILWADMGYPPGTNILEIFAYFYNKIPDGVVNDRWKQIIPEEKKFSKLVHCDFTTPEYTVFKKTKKKKWEVCRGIGNSFGYNQFESEEDYLKSKEIILMLVDIVSKNGNLLLNVGPMANGTIPEIQKKVLLELGKWLDINGEAIFGTRPWHHAEGTTLEGIPIRYTQKTNILYAILMGTPQTKSITIINFNLEDISTINILGKQKALSWRMEKDKLTIIMPESIDNAPAISFKITFNQNSKS
ncbi:MAG: alpha-L-fucosidase [Promethearchaeota archaeon]|nr:MAG: alpha-L-fucosidase [Candidatus Lokiarchaeota archaeon]